jgi:hypothetical protein
MYNDYVVLFIRKNDYCFSKSRVFGRKVKTPKGLIPFPLSKDEGKKRL